MNPGVCVQEASHQAEPSSSIHRLTDTVIRNSKWTERAGITAYTPNRNAFESVFNSTKLVFKRVGPGYAGV